MVSLTLAFSGAHCTRHGICAASCIFMTKVNSPLLCWGIYSILSPWRDMIFHARTWLHSLVVGKWAKFCFRVTAMLWQCTVALGDGSFNACPIRGRSSAVHLFYPFRWICARNRSGLFWCHCAAAHNAQSDSIHCSLSPQLLNAIFSHLPVTHFNLLRLGSPGMLNGTLVFTMASESFSPSRIAATCVTYLCDAIAQCAGISILPHSRMHFCT